MENSNTTGRELQLSRLLHAPRELVWEVFTNPEHIKNWWGPNGFTNSIFKMDIRPGGEWDFIMHGPDGTDYKNHNIFKEIEKPGRIVYEHVSAPKHVTTITLEEQDGKTMLKWHMVFESKEQFEQVVKTFKADEGLKQNIARLENYISNKKDGSFKIQRTINARVEKVWLALTDKKAMKEWYFDVSAFEPESGFEFEFKGQGHKGEQYLHLCKILEAIPYKKISYSWRYDGHPGYSVVSFELLEEGDQTMVTLTHEGLDTFPENNADFAKESFAEGWTYLLGTALPKFAAL